MMDQNGRWSLQMGQALILMSQTTGVTGQTDYTIEPVAVTANVTFTVVDHTHEMTML